VIGFPTAEFEALRRRAAAAALAPLYPFERRPPRDWRMPVPPQPIGRFSSTRRNRWDATMGGAAQLTPGLRLVWMPEAWSDGASIPFLLQTGFSPRFESATFAQAWIHDLLYGGRFVTRAMADYIFYRQLLAGGVHPVKAKAYYWAVFGWGWTAWLRHTPESVSEARRFVRLELAEAA
jgi:hypothetical protein